MSPLSHVHQRNTDAIALLQNGKFIEAYYIFRETLTTLQGSLSDGMASDQSSSQHSHDNAEWRQNRRPELRLGNETPHEDQEKIQVLPHESHYRLFGRPLHLPAADGTMASLSFDSKVRFVAILLWNMGLSRHLHGVYHPNTMQKNFRNAESLYKAAETLLDGFGQNDVNNEDQEGCDQPMMVLYLGLYNNLCHLYYHLGQRSDLQVSRESLMAMLLVVSDRDESLSPGEYVFFTSNVAFSAITSDSAPAA